MTFKEKINLFVDKHTNLKLDLLALENNYSKSELLRNNIDELIKDLDEDVTRALCEKWLCKPKINPYTIHAIKKYLKV